MQARELKPFPWAELFAITEGDTEEAGATVPAPSGEVEQENASTGTEQTAA
jgi:hypothetical protein